MNPSGVFIHPQAIVESDVIGSGTRIWAFAHVLPGAATCAASHAGADGVVTMRAGGDLPLMDQENLSGLLHHSADWV